MILYDISILGKFADVKAGFSLWRRLLGLHLKIANASRTQTRNYHTFQSPTVLNSRPCFLIFGSYKKYDILVVPLKALS